MSTDMEFAVSFARWAGDRIVGLRQTTNREKKRDGTDVTGVNRSLNDAFIGAVDDRKDGQASVRGKERTRRRGTVRVWTIDSVDGTGEYVNDSVPDHKRTSCIGISLFMQGRLTLSVVNNPFRSELFTAEADGRTRLNGRAITCSSRTLQRGSHYDYSHWKGVSYDFRGLERSFGRPIGSQSAIYQACMVARGSSVFAAFPGRAIHVIAPSALIVLRAGGRVTDLRGRQLDWSDLRRGVLYANRTSQGEALRAIAHL